MNLPSKIKIIKAHDGLPPVGTVMSDIGEYYYVKIGDTECDISHYISHLSMSLSIELGIAEEVKEAMPQWQAWEYKKGYNYYYIGDYFIIHFTENVDTYVDRERYNLGNMFPQCELAAQARDRILETLKQFHKEHKIQ